MKIEKKDTAAGIEPCILFNLITEFRLELNGFEMLIKHPGGTAEYAGRDGAGILWY